MGASLNGPSMMMLLLLNGRTGLLGCFSSVITFISLVGRVLIMWTSCCGKTLRRLSRSWRIHRGVDQNTGVQRFIPLLSCLFGVILIAKCVDSSQNAIILYQIMEINSNTADLHTQQQPNQTMVGATINEEVHDVVTFRSSGEIPEMDVRLNHAGDRLLPIVADSAHSIPEILSRPYLLVDSPFDNNVDLRIFSTIPDEWRRLLHTFYGFSFTYVIRIIVNSTPFQTGMGILWCPPAFEARNSCTYLSRSEPFLDVGIRTANHIVPLASCYPHVVINLGSTSEVVLRVPFSGIKCINEKLALVDQYIRYSSMAPLRGATNAEVANKRIYIHLEDVKLYGSQSGDLTRGPSSLAYVYDGTTPRGGFQYEGREAPPRRRDSKPKKSFQPPAEKIESQESRAWKLSDYLGAGSKFSSWIAPWLISVPELSVAAETASWATGAAADVARSLGFSKPFRPEPPKPVVQNPFRNFVHTDAEYTGTKMTMSEDSGIQITPLGPVSEDEMNLNYILRRPTFYFPFDWSDTMVPGTCLYQDPMVPSRFFIYEDNNVSGQGTVRTYVHTLLSYVTQMFAYWRGSMRFTVNMAGNKFYSGRLRAVFVPAAPIPGDNDQYPSTYLTSIYNDRTTNYHQIIDIRDADTFTLMVPYVSLTHWRHTDRLTEFFTPALFLFVETQLRRPSTVAGTVTSWVSVSAGDDFAVAAPVMPDQRILPWAPGVMTAPSAASVDIRTEGAVYQGITLPQTGDEAPAEFHFIPPPTTDSVFTANIATVGDPITSLRSLVKRPMPACTFSVDAQGAFIVDPWTELTLTGSTGSLDTWLSRIKSLYRFSSGSIRIQITVSRGVALPELDIDGVVIKLVDVRSPVLRGLGINGVYDGGVYTLSTANTPARLNALARIPSVCELPFKVNLQGVIDVEVPYYHWFDKISNLLVRGRGVASAVPYVPWSEAGSCPYVLLVYFAGSPQLTCTVYKSAADNFNCGYLIAPPITYDRAVPVASRTGDTDNPPSEDAVVGNTEAGDSNPSVSEKVHARDGTLE